MSSTVLAGSSTFMGSKLAQTPVRTVRASKTHVVTTAVVKTKVWCDCSRVVDLRAPSNNAFVGRHVRFAYGNTCYGP